MDPFDDFFGFGGGQRTRENKGPALKFKVYVSLEDIYQGKQVEVFMTKQQICPHCRGSGADNYDDIKVCSDCNGKGMKIVK
jgi:DnaJ-related protein SCJ1